MHDMKPRNLPVTLLLHLPPALRHCRAAVLEHSEVVQQRLLHARIISTGVSSRGRSKKGRMEVLGTVRGRSRTWVGLVKEHRISDRSDMQEMQERAATGTRAQALGFGMRGRLGCKDPALPHFHAGMHAGRQDEAERTAHARSVWQGCVIMANRVGTISS